MTQEDANIIDQPEERRGTLVTIDFAGTAYQVPEGMTALKALWFSGQEVVRGAGCLGGFCGACATYYHTKDDPKVRSGLACQLAVEDGMSFSFMPPFPARKALYDIHTLKDPKKDLLTLIPKPRSAKTVMPVRRRARRTSTCAPASGKPCSASSRRSQRCLWTV